MRSNTSRTRRCHRWVRQVHLWIGAWGALATVLYGFTGLMMNHRFGESAWPQGDSAQIGQTALQIPTPAQRTAEDLSSWLRDTHGLDAQVIRKGAATSNLTPPTWTLSGGDAHASWSLDYLPGTSQAQVKHSRHSTLAAFNRLHKGVGGGLAWTLLADSFAVGMLLLGLSGLWMWARGRSARQMLLSVFGLVVVVLIAILGPALL